ncbi:unnamed protein product [Nyctereutes procyonoides]|uniref:(raccoon dog) hypothetical protein n=1 Tax=Nyctereutes procyonoides TaxID=34880 RepID=A0A811YF87_NYCPR|nr:unnamed protein product [Nyctereutes procyonoides]
MAAFYANTKTSNFPFKVRSSNTEVYSIPKKRQTEKENRINGKGGDAVGFRDRTAAAKTPNRSREIDPDKQTLKRGKETKGVGLTGGSETQQTLGMMSPQPPDSLAYNALIIPLLATPQVTPCRPAWIPTDPVCAPALYDHSQSLMEHCIEPLIAPPHVPVVPHVYVPQGIVWFTKTAASPSCQYQSQAQFRDRIILGMQTNSPSMFSSRALLQSQTTAYYQGQSCPTIYGGTSPYSLYLQYIQRQQIFTAHTQGGMVQPTAAMTTIVATGYLEHESEMDLGAQKYDENPMKTSKEPKAPEPGQDALVHCLGLEPYQKPDCGLTHGVMTKGLRYCKNPEDLECNENEKHKTTEYVKKHRRKTELFTNPK